MLPQSQRNTFIFIPLAFMAGALTSFLLLRAPTPASKIEARPQSKPIAHQGSEERPNPPSAIKGDTHPRPETVISQPKLSEKNQKNYSPERVAALLPDFTLSPEIIDALGLSAEKQQEINRLLAKGRTDALALEKAATKVISNSETKQEFEISNFSDTAKPLYEKLKSDVLASLAPEKSEFLWKSIQNLGRSYFIDYAYTTKLELKLNNSGMIGVKTEMKDGDFMYRSMSQSFKEMPERYRHFYELTK